MQQSSLSSSSSTASVSAIDMKIDNNSSALFRIFLLGGSLVLVASPRATPVSIDIRSKICGDLTKPSSGNDPLGYIHTLGYLTPLLSVGACQCCVGQTIGAREFTHGGGK